MAQHCVALRRPLPQNWGMKWVLIIAVLVAAGFLGYKYLYKSRGSTPATSSSDAFMDGCRQASQNIPKVDEYCACLKEKGVKSMAMLATNPKSREAMVTCQQKVGHSAAAPGLNP